MEQKKKKFRKAVIPVIFRKEKKDGGIIAVFPTLFYAEDWRWGEVWCYAHNGQHMEINKYYYDTETVPAVKGEYESLLRELTEDVGYKNLKVYRKWLYKGKGYKDAANHSSNVLPAEGKRLADALEGKNIEIMDYKTNRVLSIHPIDIFFVQDEGSPEDESYVICVDEEEYYIGGTYYDETIRLLNGGRIEIIRVSDKKTFRAQIAA